MLSEGARSRMNQRMRLGRLEKLKSDLRFLETKAKGQRPGVPRAELGERIRQKEGGTLETIAGPNHRKHHFLCLLFAYFLIEERGHRTY